MKIGFVGLGIMGHPMALNLIKGGHQLYVYGKRTCPAPVKEAGATVCDTLKAIAEQSEVVIIMVPDTPDVADVLFAPDGVAAGLSAGKLVVDMSSISPIERRAAAMSMRRCRGARSAPRLPRSPSWSAARKRISTGSTRCSS
jgi:2-hydroxy-3-oxopropionate reductase